MKKSELRCVLQELLERVEVLEVEGTKTDELVDLLLKRTAGQEPSLRQLEVSTCAQTSYTRPLLADPPSFVISVWTHAKD